MGLIKACKELIKLSTLISSVEERDGYTIVKLKGNVVVESEGHTVIGSKNGCLVTSHQMTFINPSKGISNTDSTNLVNESMQKYLDETKYRLDNNIKVKRWQLSNKPTSFLQ